MLSDEQLDDLYTKDYSYPRTINNFMQALKTLRWLASPDEEYRLQGEHDVIYVFAGPPTSDDQQIELDRLGFRYDAENESWRHYT